MNPVVSIVIPAFNRIAPLRETLRSAERAVAALDASAEILLVDDGSEPPLAEALTDLRPDGPVRIIRQANQGSIVARLTGLQAARGEFVLFLDSDDLIAPPKLREHVARLQSADLSYDDLGSLAPDKQSVVPRARLATASTVEEVLLRVQPAPHGPMYRRSYLLAALTPPLLPLMRPHDAVGDIWLFYNLCIHPARVAKIDLPLTIIGEHDDARYSQHWERLGYASLGVMEAFMRACPGTPATRAARQLVGECAFNSWRRLPRGFDPEFSQRLLAIWRAAPDHAKMWLGGRVFQALARVFGHVGAGRIMRLRNAPYARIRTVDDAELQRLRQIR